MRFRTVLILGCSVIGVGCVAAMMTIVLSERALAQALLTTPHVVAHDLGISSGPRATVAAGNADDVGDPNDTPVTAESSDAAVVAVTPRHARDLTEAQLNALDREADRVAGVENHDARYHRRVDAALSGGGIPLPVTGIHTAARAAYASSEAATYTSEPVSEVPPEQYVEPQYAPADAYGYGYNYYGGFPANTTTTTSSSSQPTTQQQPTTPQTIQPYQTAPYQTQPAPGALRGY